MTTAPNRQVDGYRHVIGSSELGRCVKASAAALLGYDPLPPSATMQALYDSGHQHEDDCWNALVADGWAMKDAQREDVIDCGNDWCIVIHYDGIGGTPIFMQQKVVEIKSPSTWQLFERAIRTATYTDPYMSRIAWQVSCQMVASGLEAVVACVDEGRVKTFGIEALYSADSIQARVAEIRSWVEQGELPAGCSQADWPCDFRYLHEPDERVELDDPALLAAIETDQHLAQMIGDAAATRKEAKEVLDGLLPGELGRYAVGGYNLTTYEQAGAARLDEDKMRADGIEVETYRVVGKSSRRTKITPRGED